MKRSSRMLVWLLMAACAFLCSAAYASNDYQDRLRREIAERARELRNSRNGNSDRNSNRWTSLNRNQKRDNNKDKRTNPFGVDLNNPFGPGLDFATQAWDNAGRGQYGLFVGGGKGPNQSLDLNGRPLDPIRTTRTQPAQAETAPPKLTEKEREAAAKEEAEALKEATDRTVKAAQALVDNGEFGAARRMLVPIATSKRRAPEDVEAAGALIEQIDTEGMKRLATADEAAGAGNPDKAAEVYGEIARQFVTAPAGSLARTRLAVLRAKPDVAARFLYNRAVAYSGRNRADIAMPMLRDVIKKYGKTDYAARAAALLMKLEKQAAAGGGLSPDDALRARKGLMIGNIHALNGRTEQAMKNYRAVMQDFEDSKYAEIARDRIAELTK
jgi:hypothetical protein